MLAPYLPLNKTGGYTAIVESMAMTQHNCYVRPQMIVVVLHLPLRSARFMIVNDYWYRKERCDTTRSTLGLSHNWCMGRMFMSFKVASTSAVFDLDRQWGALPVR
jgi:hypothetical protein